MWNEYPLGKSIPPSTSGQASFGNSVRARRTSTGTRTRPAIEFLIFCVLTVTTEERGGRSTAGPRQAADLDEHRHMDRHPGRCSGYGPCPYGASDETTCDAQHVKAGVSVGSE